MSDSLPASLPFSPLATSSSTREATDLYRELRKPLLRYLMCLGLTTDEAQDVVQDSFLTLHRHLSSGGAQDNIRSWLFRVAHNQARNRQKRYDRHFTSSIDQEADSVLDHATPEHAVLEKEKLTRLRRAIRSLTSSERECLLLRAGGLRYREIGEVLGLPTSTVGDTVERALKKLVEKFHV